MTSQHGTPTPGPAPTPKNRFENVVGVLSLVGGIATVVLYLNRSTRLVALVVAAVLVAVIPTVLALGSARRPATAGEAADRSPNWGKAVATLAVSASLVLTALAVLGFAQRESYAFARHYGTQVQVEGEQDCWNYSNMRQDTNYTTCDATWQADGETVDGTLYTGGGDWGTKGHDAGTGAIAAYAWGDKAFTDTYDGEESPLYPVGLVPGWLLGALPVAIIGVLLVRRLRRPARVDG
ncbi:hypothetical protein K7640_10955 [Micromonospora sp. PLK6-60]|uniref:hypothetical protein n=1 Tax=Micromonospora sp. PLK6-60 TaxID=2873383 RepID=UPI001CA6F356|nr:hypothetical protein [Micromonospora sp. PLK6-60]MBY8872358.1 hypothetical protein [Micromonospora sp. PLK6-60]